MTEVRGQTTDGRGRRIEDRGQMSDDKGKKVRCWEGVKVRETSNPDFVNHGRMCRFNVYPVLNTIKGPNQRRQEQDQVAPGRQPEQPTAAACRSVWW